MSSEKKINYYVCLLSFAEIDAHRETTTQAPRSTVVHSGTMVSLFKCFERSIHLIQVRYSTVATNQHRESCRQPMQLIDATVSLAADKNKKSRDWRTKRFAVTGQQVQEYSNKQLDVKSSAKRSILATVQSARTICRSTDPTLRYCIYIYLYLTRADGRVAHLESCGRRQLLLTIG